MRLLSYARRLAVLATALSSCQLVAADNLYQAYCSSENTGVDYPRAYWMYQSDGWCYTHCEGYAFAVVQGFYCWCSNYVPAERVSVSKCNMACHGYPQEACGNSDTGYYGYVAAGGKPSGTAGVSSPGQTGSSGSGVKSVTVPSSTSRMTTHHDSISSTIHSTSEMTTSRPGITPSASSASVSVERITVSGGVSTKYVTATPPSAPSSNTIPVQTSKGGGLSDGAVAGITIGVIAALAIIGGLLFYFCFWVPRRRRREEDEAAMPPSSRTTSNRSPQRPSSLFNAMGGRPLPPIQTGGFGSLSDEQGTNSQTISPMTQRRNSQPMFIDSRLNPNTLMSNSNTSHTSVSTLQDDQDYSRPVLSVRNPDQH